MRRAVGVHRRLPQVDVAPAAQQGTVPAAPCGWHHPSSLCLPRQLQCWQKGLGSDPPPRGKASSGCCHLLGARRAHRAVVRLVKVQGTGRMPNLARTWLAGLTGWTRPHWHRPPLRRCACMLACMLVCVYACSPCTCGCPSRCHYECMTQSLRICDMHTHSPPLLQHP